MRSRILALAIGLVLCCALLGIGEVLCTFLLNGLYDIHHVYQQDVQYFNDDGVLSITPGEHEHQLLHSSTDREIFRAIYSIDEHGRRITPLDEPIDATQFLITLGGSHTFGIGVQDTETYPYYLQQQLNTHRVYSYGYGGNGPFDVLATVQSRDMSLEVQEDNGTILYYYIDHHIRRTHPSMRQLEWGHSRPYYTTNASGALIHSGTFADAFPMRTRLYNVLAKSNILRYFNINIPLTLRDNNFTLFANVIDRIREESLHQFPEANFVVVIAPGSRYTNDVIDALQQRHIDTVDLTTLYDKSDPQYFIAPEDKHPTPAAYKLIADALRKHLHLL